MVGPRRTRYRPGEGMGVAAVESKLMVKSVFILLMGHDTRQRLKEERSERTRCEVHPSESKVKSFIPT